MFVCSKFPLCRNSPIILRELKNNNEPKAAKLLSTTANLKRFEKWNKFKDAFYKSIPSSTLMKAGGHVTYEKCSNAIDYFEFFRYFNLPDTFHSWFLVMQLHVWMCIAVTIIEQHGRQFKYHIVNSMWKDVESRVAQLQEIPSSSRRKYLTEMKEQFRPFKVSWDEGLISEDTTLAAAAWRTLYDCHNIDPRLLEAIVLYVRKQINHLDSLNTEEFMVRGSVSFLTIKDIMSHPTF
ncbi:ubiquinol-cytochrome-c reductase complex assembly factor 1 [Caerostris darwini]|uniref:Ubiquinol-cytochrome-c reductase complex assembly factor 1 n=1 Tax=Caerostris darwini TaxID=1538125 RepID=A0AAV4PC39_9ARAC|nr:ubiquinol-cytochrome-c reductase complex assembly factor 1 [Caerostris darwini]